ncbi:MAG: N-acetylmuramoyl-L-alanine amidase, partial [Candidatus Gygaella obscura]|nr:N-acetylmuramoyl-L-alanine amidase [Candidatus Gygaella obscura]
MIRRKKVSSLILITAFLFISGCVSLPRLRDVPSFSINNKNYYSLISLCDELEVDFDFDVQAQKVILEDDESSITLGVDYDWIIINEEEKRIKNPPIVSEGVVLVTYATMRIIADTFLKKEAPKEKKVKLYRKIKRIVIDPGHGGKDPGAIGTYGLMEKNVNLTIAKSLYGKLKSFGYEVLLTRKSDRFLSLAQRANIANRFNADLFISVHANANHSKQMNGFEIYYCSDTLEESIRSIVAEENGIMVNRRDYIEVADRGNKRIENKLNSIGIAEGICQQVSATNGLNVIGVKGAPFYVLRFTTMPAILIEAGFLSNLEEEKLLADNNYCCLLAEKIALGVKSFKNRSLVRR